MNNKNKDTFYKVSNMTDELNLISLLFDKYGLRSVSDFAKSTGLTRQAVYKRIEKGKQMYVELAGMKFIIKNN